MGRRDSRACSPGRNLRPRRSAVVYIKDEEEQSEDEDSYTPRVTRSRRILEQDAPDSPPSTDSPASTPQSSASKNSTPLKRTICTRSKVNNKVSSGDPSPKKRKVNADIVKMEDPSDDDYGKDPGVSSHNFLKLPEDLKAESMKDLHPLDYRHRIQASIRMYKALGLRYAHSHNYPFLHRNLLYNRGYISKDIPSYVLGIDEPPLVWPYTKKVHKRSRNKEEKKMRLTNIINTLPKMKKLQRSIAHAHGIKGYQFGVETIAKASIKGKIALTNDKKYRIFLKNSGKTVPPFVPFAYPNVREHQDKMLSMITPSASRDSSLARNPNSGFFYSIKFKQVKYHMMYGDRLAQVEVYMVDQVKDKFEKPCRVDAPSFIMKVDKSQPAIAIDLSHVRPKYGLMKHLLLKVMISSNQNDCSIEGHTLRNTASRLSAQSPAKEDERNLRSKKESTDSPKSVTWEQTFYGTSLVYKDPSIRGLKGYIQGDLSVSLIEDSDIPSSFSSPNFIETIQDISRKMHCNPFVLASLGKFYVDDLSDDSEDGESDPRAQKVVETRAKQENVSASSHEHRHSQDADDDKEGLRTVLDVYTGQFKWDTQGRYVNDREMIKHLFREEVFKDKHKIAAIRKWICLTIPKKIVYRIMCQAEHISSATFGDEMDEHLTSPEDFEMNFASVEQNTSPNECIICNRKFSNMFALMMHYHTNYPRLSFIFQIGNRSYKKFLSSDEVRIDVLLDPNHTDCDEATFSVTPIRRMSSPPLFLTTKCQSRALRAFMRMDLTLFCRFLRLPDVIDDTTVANSRYVDTISGRMLRVGETQDVSPNSIPQPSYNALVKRMNETILDYIDIDEKTKRYMCTWNKMTLAFGRGNQCKAGIYMTHRLFLKMFGEIIKESQQMDRFVAQILDEVEKGALTGDDQYDLVCRLNSRKYNPLDDPLSSIHQELILYAKRQYKKYSQAVASAKAPMLIGSVRRTFHRFYRSDPSTMGETKKKELIRFLFNHTEAIQKNDPRRNYLVSPFRMLFNGRIPELLKDMPPV